MILTLYNALLTTRLSIESGEDDGNLGKAGLPIFGITEKERENNNMDVN